MSEELSELHEHAEHAREHPDLAPVTLTMAVLAVLVATVSLLGHRTHTEEIILQNQVTDKWAYFQAKNIRLHNDELFADLAGVVTSKDAEGTAKFEEKVRAEVAAYKEDKKKLEAEGHELEGNSRSPTGKPTASISAKSSWRSRWWSPRLHCCREGAYSGILGC